VCLVDKPLGLLSDGTSGTDWCDENIDWNGDQATVDLGGCSVDVTFGQDGTGSFQDSILF